MSPLHSGWAVSALVTLGYLFLARFLRFRRLNAIESNAVEPLAMTPADAQKIVHGVLLYDMPLMVRVGAQIALFKTYGIPSIASLLLRTGELASAHYTSKRVTDTALLISTFLQVPIVGPYSGSPVQDDSDPRGAIAIARVNWLHRRYNISNDDMLYTLSCFIFEPINVTEKFDWRPYSPVEKQAAFVLWREYGRRMGIEDIPSTMAELQQWSENYELVHMIPSESSQALASKTIGYISQRFPTALGLRGLIISLFISIFDERLRKAMRLPGQPLWAHRTVHSIFCIRAFIIRHLLLPRIRPEGYIPQDTLPADLDREGLLRLHTVVRRPYPWYYPSSTGMRQYLDRFKIRIGILSEDRLPGDKYNSQGYRLEELGPIRLEKDGHEEVFTEAESIHGSEIGMPWKARHSQHKE